MAEKKSTRIVDGDTCDVSSNSDATTSVHQIRDKPVEQFTKVSDFCHQVFFSSGFLFLDILFKLFNVLYYYYYCY